MAPVVPDVPRLRAGLPEAFRGQHEVVTPALEPAAEYVFGRPGKVDATAQRVDVRGVDERDPRAGGAIQHGPGRRLVDLQAECHGPQAEP